MNANLETTCEYHGRIGYDLIADFQSLLQQLLSEAYERSDQAFKTSKRDFYSEAQVCGTDYVIADSLMSLFLTFVAERGAVEANASFYIGPNDNVRELWQLSVGI